MRFRVIWFCVLALLLESVFGLNPVVASLASRELVPTIATPEPSPTGAFEHFFPDAAVVASPITRDFDVAAYLESRGGFLAGYQQYLMISGWTPAATVIERVARENSINPQLLLALLEYQSQCVLGQPPDPQNFTSALGAQAYYRKDLYGQLVWAARTLSEGFYGRMTGALTEISFPDGTILTLSEAINPGTAALYYFFAQLNNPVEWAQAINPQSGFLALYVQMFGDPWEAAAEFGELLPEGLTQPELVLPFETGRTWAYTGGPHPAFEGVGPRAALDFAPSMAVSGCAPSTEWVTAMADGWVVRAEEGVVVQELDGDGYEQTGWVLMYLHIDSQDHAVVGAYLKAGDRLGHPSCEGGRATGTHVHVARKYNGVWIPADGPVPFTLSGWVAHAGEEPYLGTLTRQEEVIVAHQFGSAVSHIQRQE